MVFLKVIPTSLLFIHGSAGHCNLETRVINSIQGTVKKAVARKSGEAEKSGEGESGAVVWNMGLDIRP